MVTYLVDLDRRFIVAVIRDEVTIVFVGVCVCVLVSGCEDRVLLWVDIDFVLRRMEVDSI